VVDTVICIVVVAVFRFSFKQIFYKTYAYFFLLSAVTELTR